MWLNKKKYVSSGSLSQLAWRRFRKNSIGFSSFLFILFSVLVALMAYVISPDHSPMANEQNLVLNTKKPGFKVMVLRVKNNSTPQSGNFLNRIISGEKSEFTEIPISQYRFGTNCVIVNEYTGDTQKGRELTFNFPDIVFALDEDADISVLDSTTRFTTIDDNSIETTISDLKDIIVRKHIREKTYYLGTDRYGRDVLSQLIIGTRVSLSVGLIAVIISLVVGIFLGAVAGYFGGKTDSFIIWLINVIWAVPTLLLVIAITFALGKGFWQVFIAVGLTMWVEVARVVRGQFMSLREKEFVEAAKALGFKNFRIIFKHVLPNSLAPVIVISAANFASAILLEAGLSFLGIGVQPPMPSWGTMIRENYGYIILDYAYLAILPGIAIMLMVLAFMLVGNGLRDALDVKTSES